MYNYYRMGRSRNSSYLLITFWTTEMRQIRSIKSNILNRIGDVFLCQHRIMLDNFKSFDFGVIFVLFPEFQKQNITLILWIRIEFCRIIAICLLQLHVQNQPNYYYIHGYRSNGRTNPVSSLFILQNGNSRSISNIRSSLYLHRTKYIIMMAFIGC